MWPRDPIKTSDPPSRRKKAKICKGRVYCVYQVFVKMFWRFATVLTTKCYNVTTCTYFGFRAKQSSLPLDALYSRPSQWLRPLEIRDDVPRPLRVTLM